MPSETERLVVMRHTPARSGLFRGAMLVGAILVLWGSFEAGRMLAGYSVLRAVREEVTLALEVRNLRAKLHDAEARLAAAEVARRVDHEAEAQVEKSLAEFQARLGEATQELAFYRSIVSPSDGIFGMRIQRLRVQPAIAPGHYRVRLVLVQAAQKEGVTSATAEFAVDGQRSGQATTLPLSEIGTSSRVLSFSFRYFQEVETEIELPVDFVPQTVQVEVHPARGASPIRQSFPWKIETT